MLCQALLTALAVTCTLSRIHAHGQSAQRLDRIKDLMCVLILSGIQKEDLDVNMLKKLQRHNVNISEMNNEELRRKCKGLDLKVAKNVTTTEVYPLQDISKSQTDKSLYINFATGEISQRQIYLDPTQKKDNYDIESVIKETSTTPRVSSNEVTMNKAYIEYNDGTPKIENILSFWDKFVKVNKRDSLAVTPSSPNNLNRDRSKDGYEQINKRDVRDDRSTNESYMINKMLTNFLLQKNNFNTDRPTTDFVLENVFDDNTSSNDRYGNIHKNSLKNKSNIENTLQEIESKNNEKNEPRNLFGDIDSEEVTRNPYMSFKDMLAEIEQKTAFPFLELGPKKYDRYKNTENEPPKLSNDFNLDSLLKSNSAMTNKYLVKEPRQAISRDIIKDIAESVKALVLKDLRNEVRETTSQSAPTIQTTSQKYTFTTTQGTTRPPVTKKVGTVQESVLSKFMELFEQIKSLKNNPVVITQEHQNTTFQKEHKEDFKKIIAELPLSQNGDAKVMIPKFVPTIDLPSTIKQVVNMPVMNPVPTNNIKPFNLYEFSPQIHKFRNPVIVPVKVPIKTHASIKKKAAPITFQTNALEIPPIGVYMDKPHDPINQNIIVTTLTPKRVINKGRHMNHGSELEIHNEEISNKPNNLVSKSGAYCSTHVCSRIQKPKQRHRFKSLSSNDDSRYTSHMKSLNRYMTYSDPGHVEKQISLPRYYEKLEKLDEELSNKKKYIDCCEDKYVNSQPVSDCCNRKVVSRQQISLNPIKKGYDDTHFKNFLKSQQKVTDMLERILAVKNKLRSVESI